MFAQERQVIRMKMDRDVGGVLDLMDGLAHDRRGPFQAVAVHTHVGGVAGGNGFPAAGGERQPDQ